MLVSFMDEVLGSLPVFFKKGFNYSVDGKKIFIKDLRLITGLNLLDLLKTFYIALPRRRNRCKLVKSINTYSVMLTLLCSDFAFSFYRELFLFLDTINFHLNFSVNNRFLLAYFLRNLNFC